MKEQYTVLKRKLMKQTSFKNLVFIYLFTFVSKLNRSLKI